MPSFRCYQKTLLISYSFCCLTGCLGKSDHSGDTISTDDLEASVLSENIVSPFDVVTDDSQSLIISATPSGQVVTGSDQLVKVSGVIDSFVSASYFLIDGLVVDASHSSRFDDGVMADLSNGMCIEARGNLVNRLSSTVLLATRVRFEDDYCSQPAY